MKNSVAVKAVLLMVVFAGAETTGAAAADVYRKRFDPPRIYFTNSSLNKSGITHGIKGQDNFLDFYITPVDNTKGQYTAEGFSYTVIVPAFVDMLDIEEQGLTVTEIEWQGQPHKAVTRELNSAMVQARCLRGDYGSEYQWLWYRIAEDREIPSTLQNISVTLHYKGRECATDTSRLRIHEELSPPRLSAEYFKLYLHGSPRYRRGKWDQLADYLARAGFNTVLSLESLEFNREMQKRGLYVIHQQSGSYHQIYEDDFRSCVIEGPKWFGKADGGHTAEQLAYSDGTLWDFEPGAAGRITGINLDPWFIDRFKKEHNIPAHTELTREIIQNQYFEEWITFRQNLAALCVKHWAEFSRSIKPDIETIATEGAVNRFDIATDADYAKYAKYVTYCDPMNFVAPSSLQNMKKWMRRVPEGQFLGCQNLGVGGYGTVFIPDQDTMLQVLGAAMIGCKGTSLYPGNCMDAKNFVLFNRVMSFMASNQDIMFEGTPDPANVMLSPIPKEDTEIDLGDGNKIRNTYPDWDHDAKIRAYYSSKLNEYLVVVNNRNRKETCHLKLTANLPKGTWFIVDDETRALAMSNGKANIPSDSFARDIYLPCPPYEYRGFRIKPALAAIPDVLKSYRPIDLEESRKDALAYSQSGERVNDAITDGALSLGFDDCDQDSRFEYLVQSPGQKTWVSQNGTIVKWQIDDQVIDTTQLGLCNDMLWLPQSERTNGEMATVMRLEERKVQADRIVLVFSKVAALDSLGGMVSVKLTKEFTFYEEPGEVSVRVSIFNDSLSMEVPSIDLSYRVHNYIDYTGTGKTVAWTNDGSQIIKQIGGLTHTVLNTGLTQNETLEAFGQCDVLGPHDIVSFGEYFPQKQLLLSFHAQDPSRILQMLRWGRGDETGDEGTIEWMYRPETLAQGNEISYEYQIKLKTAVELPNPAAVEQTRPRKQNNEVDNHLVFHLDFENTCDAVVSKGNPKAEITGKPVYEQSPNGMGIVMTKASKLSYLPQGNINLQKGKLYIHFKPLWHGSDGEKHFFLTVTPKPGLVYFGKLDDGRLLFNMFDKDGQQHWPHHGIRDMAPGDWHKATVAWDADKGKIVLFLDGEKVAESNSHPWQMGKLGNSLDTCRITIPGSEIVIDEIKIWDR